MDDPNHLDAVAVEYIENMVLLDDESMHRWQAKILTCLAYPWSPRQRLHGLNEPLDHTLRRQRFPLSDVRVDVEGRPAPSAQGPAASCPHLTTTAKFIPQRVPRCVIHLDALATLKLG